MNEISSRKELVEVNNPVSEGFKKIKPEYNTSVKEARNFINDIFKKEDIIDNKEIKNDFKKFNNDVNSDNDKHQLNYNFETSENNEVKEKLGGSYNDVKKTSDGEKHEVHHTPADSASNLERNDGPAIRMEKEDHRQTASCGNSKEAREFREKQKELIDQGKFREALQMDIDDLHEKFGDKYDDAITEMSDYVDQLEKERKI
ncbi:hypothetical protein [Oribacterium sp. FC2011]|uniref:hypothetical protein n=1 Tax=Oribacterium sp. FC2011 TaxID=1408311 RepID=UPI0004E1468F|nr:hypothetical protein [Oribacterium sp. FC2011]